MRVLFTNLLVIYSKVWILAYYGNRVFEKLVGDDIALPLLYLAAIIFGSMTYVRPTYWRYKCITKSKELWKFRCFKLKSGKAHMIWCPREFPKILCLIFTQDCYVTDLVLLGSVLFNDGDQHGCADFSNTRLGGSSTKWSGKHQYFFSFIFHKIQKVKVASTFSYFI